MAPARSATIGLRPWLGHLVEHVAVARAGADAEGAHQVRIASGRLDVWLRMAGERALRDDLRALRRAASEQRDLDVFLERRLPAALRKWALAERAAAHAKLVAVLDAPRTEALVAALALLPDLPRAAAQEYERRAAEVVERRARAALQAEAAIPELHALRRALRRRRYAREWLRRAATRLKVLQDELGALNDAAVALELTLRCPQADELGRWRTQLGEELRRRTAQAQAACRRARLAVGNRDA